jgi:hypothetical protein
MAAQKWRLLTRVPDRYLARLKARIRKGNTLTKNPWEKMLLTGDHIRKSPANKGGRSIIITGRLVCFHVHGLLLLDR